MKVQQALMEVSHIPLGTTESKLGKADFTPSEAPMSSLFKGNRLDQTTAKALYSTARPSEVVFALYRGGKSIKQQFWH
jgi:hypothetical protein